MGIDPGAFLRGLTKGLFAAQEMRERREATEERKARLSEERARQKADYLFQIRGLTEATADPETHERLLATAEEAGQAFGFKPGELRTVIGGFPESKKNRRRQTLAKERVADLQRIYEGRFWTPEVQGFMVSFEGQTIPVRDLVSIADILATREVKRPIREEVQVPRAEEGGLARFLTPRTEERVVGEEIVREPALPIPAQPLTFEQLYEKARGTPWQGRQVPTTKEGLPDLKAATQIAKDNGWIVTNEDQFRVRERYQKFLRDKLVAGMRGPGVDLGVLRKQMEQAGMNWAAERDKARQEIALVAATLAQKLRTPEGRDRSGLSAGQNRIVNQYDELDRQEQSALGMISRAIDPDAPEIVELRDRVKDLRQRKARIFQQNPWIAPYIGVAPPSPAPTGDGGGARTLTMAQIAAGAKTANISVEQAIADAEKQGYTIIDKPAKPAKPPAPTEPRGKPLPLTGQTRVVAGQKIPVPVQRMDKPVKVPPRLPSAPTERVANLLRLVRLQNRAVSKAEWGSLSDRERKWLRAAGVEVET